MTNENAFEGATVEGRPAISGRFVAYAAIVEDERYGGGCCIGEYVERVNARTGQFESTPADGKAGIGFGGDSPRGVTDVVVTAAGSVAWMIEGKFNNPSGELPAGGGLPPASNAIYLLASASTTPVLLAYNPMIEPGSLAAIPGHIYWLEAGAAHTYAAA
jgi:hypothetical protein